MQKKIIALAVAGLVSGAAFAQTNVTLYGRIDIGYVYSKSDFSKFSGIENGQGINGGSSRIGIRGEEALGNGLKAIFEAEWGTKTDEGLGIVDARWSYVGLSGNFGRVIAGRLRTPTDLYAGSTSSNGINGFLPNNEFRKKLGWDGTLKDGKPVRSDILNGSRWNNSIGYISPNLSGVEFAAVYSFGEKRSVAHNKDTGYQNDEAGASTFEKAKVTDAGKLGLGVKYANGPLYLMAAYEQRADDDSKLLWQDGANTGYGSKGWNIGGSYDFKVVKVYANYSRIKANHGGLASAAEDNTKKLLPYPNVGADFGSDKESLWSLGLDVPVSRVGTLSVEYAQYKDYGGGSVNVNGTPIVYASRAVQDGSLTRSPGHKAKGYSIGYKHVLSKRTTAYAYVSRFDNDRGIKMADDKTGLAGEDQTNFAVGIYHTF